MKLKQGDLIQVHGFVMLAKLPEGQYRVKDTKPYGSLEAYTFCRPNGNKTIVRHAADSVDAWIREPNHPDLNRIEILTPAEQP